MRKSKLKYFQKVMSIVASMTALVLLTGMTGKTANDKEYFQEEVLFRR